MEKHKKTPSLPKEKDTSGQPDCECGNENEPKSESDLLTCPKCGLTFTSEEEYTRHLNDKHKIGSSISTPIY